jgi:hypothetical protein
VGPTLAPHVIAALQPRILALPRAWCTAAAGRDAPAFHAVPARAPNAIHERTRMAPPTMIS